MRQIRGAEVAVSVYTFNGLEPSGREHFGGYFGAQGDVMRKMACDVSFGPALISAAPTASP